MKSAAGLSAHNSLQPAGVPQYPLIFLSYAYIAMTTYTTMSAAPVATTQSVVHPRLAQVVDRHWYTPANSPVPLLWPRVWL